MESVKSYLLAIFLILVISVSGADSIENQDYTLSGDSVMGREHVTEFYYEVQVDYQPVDTSLVIDESGSMDGQLSDAKKAAKNYIDDTRTSDGDENAVVEFESSASTIQPLTSNKQDAKDAIDSITAGGGTDLPAGVDEGHDSLKDGTNDQQVMIVLADGGGGDPGTEADQARNDGIKIHGIMYGSGASTSEFESLTNSDCVTDSSENDDGDNCWYAETGTINSVYDAIRKETQSETSGDLHAIMPSHTHSFDRDPDNILASGEKEYIFNNIDVSDGSHTIDFPWHPTEQGTGLPMKTGNSYIAFTEDGSTTDYYFDQTESRDISYVDFNITDSYVIRKEGNIEVSVTVKNEGNTASRETSFNIYDESGNSIDETLPQLSPGETETYSYNLDKSHPVYDDAEMIRAKADVSGVWGSDGKELEPDEENNVRKMGYPAFPANINPDNAQYGDDLVEEVDLDHPEYSALYGYYDLWVGYNGYEPSDGQPELRHDNRSYDSTGSFTYTQSEEVDRAETYWNFTNRVNDTYGSMSIFNYSLYVDNPPPVITDHNPENEGFTSEYPVPASAEAKDANDAQFTIYLFNHTDDYLLTKQTVSDFEEVSHDWRVPEAHSDYQMRITVEDRWDNTTEIVDFMKIIGQGFAMESDFDHSYSSVILSSSSSRNVLYEVENTRSFEREINLTLSGVEASFGDGKSYKTVILGADESREFLLTVRPQEIGFRYLNVTMSHTAINYNDTESMPVYVRDKTGVSSSKEVPGLGTLQLLFIVLVSFCLYSARL